MANITGTIISLKNFLFNKETQITFKDKGIDIPVLYFRKDRVISVPDYQREIRWQKETLFALMNDISHKEKFLGNIILSAKNNKDYQIIDGQQRVVSLHMLVQYIKCKYAEQINDIENLITIKLNRFDGFNTFQNYEYDIEKVPPELRNNVVESDKLHQIKRLSELYTFIDNSFILDNADKARRFIDNLRMCQINVIVTDEEDVKSSTEYYIDVNLKGIKLDTEDIFKGYLLSQDSSPRIRNAWVELKEAWLELDSSLESINSKGAYQLTKILEHYIYCDIFQKNEYEKINIDEEFLLTSQCIINSTLYYAGDHVIKVINNNSFMQQVIEGSTKYIKFLTEIIKEVGGVPGGLRDLLCELNDKNQRVICNIIKKSIADKALIVPKMLILKYYLSIATGNATKDVCKGIYAVYFYSVFFMLFGDKKTDSDTIKRIARSQEYYTPLLDAISKITSEKRLADSRLIAISRWNSNYENEQLQYKCKSLATIYNFFKISEKKVTISKAEKVLSFLNNDSEYSIEHFIVNKSGKVKYKDEEYSLPDNVKQYNSYIFNFIFIPQDINANILEDNPIDKKIELLHQDKFFNMIKCDYSKMVLETINGIFKIPQPQKLDESEKEELDKYWLVTFKREYSKYVTLVIDKIIERFKIQAKRQTQ